MTFATSSRRAGAGRVLSAIVVGALVSGCAGDDGYAPNLDRITEEGLRTDLFALSHDSMAGRLVGTPELEKASDWIRDRFDALGLEPAGDNGTYDQRFDLVSLVLPSVEQLMVISLPTSCSPELRLRRTSQARRT